MAMDMQRGFAPIASDSVPWQDWSEGTRFGERFRHLTRAVAGDDYHVGVAIEELAPGRQSTPAHYHIFEEEHVYVLDGALTVRSGDTRQAMRAGDYICFPAGDRVGHCLINEGDQPCRYVIIGERNPRDVVIYSDSGKLLVRALGDDRLFDMAATRGYWDGEDTGAARHGASPVEPRTAIDAGAPAVPLSADSVEWLVEGEGRNFRGRSRHLTQAAVGDDYHVGVLIESPEPGVRMWPTHYHMLEEEHVLMLEGEAMLILGDERLPMTAGDYVRFPAGRKLGHSIVNAGTGPCHYLMIGERNPNEVCVYPDSNKVAVDALRDGDRIFDMGAARQYWDGEATG